MLKNLGKVYIYTDYSPRREGNSLYDGEDIPNVEVDLRLIDDAGSHRETSRDRRYVLPGYSAPEEFYQPDYTNKPLPSTKDYRRTLSRLRAHMKLLENRLREQDYTFSYEEQPSAAMLKYRKAFLRHDAERYEAFLEKAERGEAVLHTSSLNPCDLVQRAMARSAMSNPVERKALDVSWNALEDFTDQRNALCVIDTSGSMFGYGNPCPFAVALSLGLYFAERNRGPFQGRFITFSHRPRLIEIQGRDLAEKVAYCEALSEVADTNIQAVFELILDAAIGWHVPKSEMPETLYIISDMEFNCCTQDASRTNFEYARQLYTAHGYRLPKVVFWNVQSRSTHQPVERNEQGVMLVSGYTPRMFRLVASDKMSPYGIMLEVLRSERYRQICA